MTDTFLVEAFRRELPKCTERAVVQVLKVNLKLVAAHVQRRLVRLDDAGNLRQLVAWKLQIRKTKTKKKKIQRKQ